MIVAVASGKGGTGKTTVAVSLALAAEAIGRNPPLFIDCDVEEPNAGLFLNPEILQSKDVGVLIPEIDPSPCTLCGRCAEVCAYHALAVTGSQVLVFPELCHGCGSCTFNCPENAIQERLHVTGVLEMGRAGGMAFAQGRLNIGHAMATPIIRALKAQTLARIGEYDPVILDAPPGTSCPVIETVRGADFVLLVTEPTPFGLHDLRATIDVIRDELNLPVGVVINRDGLGDDEVESYCRETNIPILMRIPYDPAIAKVYSNGGTLVGNFPAYRREFETLLQAILNKVPA